MATDRRALRAAAIDRVPDQHFLLTLAVAIDTPVALLHHIGVVGNLQMDEPVAVVLQVDAFGRRIGGEQDAHRRILRRGLECRLDGFALFLGEGAMQQTETLAAEAVAGEDLMHPLMRGAVFGE